MPMRPNLHARRLARLGPLVCALRLALGCNSLKPVPPPIEKVEREPTLGLPGKQSWRLSQYVFLHDFELQHDLPLFQELARLRDQVYKELQLPAANTVVQVYLFEDRD